MTGGRDDYEGRPRTNPGGDPIIDPRPFEWWRPLYFISWRRSPRGTIPNRWLSVSTSRRPQLANDGPGRAISLGLGLKGCVAEGTTSAGCRLRWGRSTDAEGEGDVRAASVRMVLAPAA